MVHHVQVSMPVAEESQPASARRQALRLARETHLDDRVMGDVALVVTELATNLVKHAKSGELLMRCLGQDGSEGMEILSLDKGPGIPDVARALGDGYSTAGSPGTGLGAVVRIASEFDIYSQPGKGTAFVARLLAKRGKEASSSALGVIHQPKQGETISGDQWIVRWFTDGWLCAVADGLGHGLVAAEAASSIMQAMRGAQGKKTPVEL